MRPGSTSSSCSTTTRRQFDEHLVGALHYQGHSFLIDRLKQLARRHFGAALDLGCGTGLCGPLVKPMVDHLDGVDLSHDMVARRSARGVYEQLVQGDVVEYLQTTQRRYELVLSADVFIYIGDLDPVFAGCRGHGRGVPLLFLLRRRRTTPWTSCSHRVCAMRIRSATSAGWQRGMASRSSNIVRHPIREDQRQPVGGVYAYLTAG